MKAIMGLMVMMAMSFACDSESDGSTDEGTDDSDNLSDAGSGTDTQSANDSDTYPVPDKIIALTFDDGPENTKTNEVLDKLETHGATASFFVIGQRISDSTKDTMLRAVSLGCDIQNHSFGTASMDSMTAEQITTSVNDTTAAIEAYAGVSPSFFRPPNLATSALMYETIPYPFASGITANDWESSATPESIADRIINSVQDGSIILLHDNQPFNPHPTIAALDTIIPELRMQGYEIVTLTELFARKGVDPASKTTGMWTRVP
jgi:peptidoglycan/xylan/chitin deacetylase (PgdA/CDA1 family)